MIYDEFMAELDIELNRRRHDVKCLRFIDEGESFETEELRNKVWNMYVANAKYSEMTKVLGINRKELKTHLSKCKKYHDAWITENRLGLHGNDECRLEDTVRDLQNDLAEIQTVSQMCLDEGDVRGYKDLKSIGVLIRKDIAKFMGVEPPKKVDMTLTSAEETRKTMMELFPSDTDEVKDTD